MPIVDTLDCRGVLESAQCQGETESIVWAVVLDPAPTMLTSVTVYDVTMLDADVTATVMPVGSPSLAGDTAVLPPLTNLVVGHGYRISIQYSDGTNNLEAHFSVVCS